MGSRIGMNEWIYNFYNDGVYSIFGTDTAFLD